MRVYTACLTGFALALLPFVSLSASADSYLSGAQANPNLPQPTAQSCPAGQHWEPAGYVAEGKWRDGHCSANENGRE